MRFIDADDLKEDVFPYGLKDPDLILEMIDDAPTVDAVEVVHGYMEQLERITVKVPHCRCSVCNKLVVGWKSEINFCPNCGARMDALEND